MIRVAVVNDWRNNPPPTRFFNRDEARWSLSLSEEDAELCLATELSSIPNARLMSLSGTVLAVMMLLLPISIFAILGNGLYDLLLEDQPSPRIYLVVLGSLLSYVVLAAFAAGSNRFSLLSQELGAMADGIRDITRRFHQHPLLMFRAARKWASNNRLEQAPRIDVWNPGLPSANKTKTVFWDILLPLFAKQGAADCILILHVRSDEMAAVRAAIKERYHLQLDLAPDATQEQGGSRRSPALVLSLRERHLLQIMRVASFPLHQLLTDPLCASAAGPACFSENAFLRMVRSFAGDHEQEFVHRFLARCRNDYGYLDMHPDQVEILQLADDAAQATLDDARNLAFRARQLLISDPRRFLHDGDPCAQLCSVNALAVLHDGANDDPRLQQNLKQQLRTLIGETIDSLERSEHYPLFRHIAQQEFSDGPSKGQIAHHLPQVINEVKADGDIGGAILKLTRFNAFDTATLTRLARLLEVGGFYPAATEVWEKLKNTDPLLAGIRLARLKERNGNAASIAEAFAEIRRLLASDFLAGRPDIHVAALLEGAWLCYSAQAPDELDQGSAWLEAAARELERCPGEPEAYWRLHNYRALYHDAGRRYEEAIAENQKALAIPGIQLKWYSGSLTNLAYVSRKHALSRRDDRATADRLLGEALEYAKLAVDLKRRIDDKDELPVALHNLALVHLCRGLLAGGAEKTGNAEEAEITCDQALEILDRIKSNKKRFALSLEATLAAGLLGADWRSALECARRAQPNARECAVLDRIEANEDAFAALCDAVLAMEILD